MKKAIYILVRLLLALFVGADIVVAAMTGYHWKIGGVDGVKAWIAHMHLASGRSFDVPVTQETVNRGIAEFTYVIVALALLTIAAAFGDRLLRRRQKHVETS
ncbi:MAG TPA: hypothetical protein VF135_06045 [Terriglobales bacterium]